MPVDNAANRPTNLGTLGTKNPPIDVDKVIQRDSTAGDALVTSTWTQVKAFLKTYLDTLYSTLAHHARHEAGGADAMAIDAAAGTGSLRTLAGSGAALSAAHSDHTHTLVADVLGSALPGNITASSGTYYRYQLLVAAGSDSAAITATLTFAAGSRAVGVAVSYGQSSQLIGASLKLDLYMGGVLVAESSNLSSLLTTFRVLVGTAALSGSQQVVARFHNYGVVDDYFNSFGGSATMYPAYCVAAGSIKI
jgi:hypothetical protein